jgi:hypothetical protein
MATAKREAWADAVDPWRQFFSSKIPFRFNKALFLFGLNPPNPVPTPGNLQRKKMPVSGGRIH